MSFCLDIFAHFVMEADAPLHPDAGHRFGERPADCMAYFAFPLCFMADQHAFRKHYEA